MSTDAARREDAEHAPHPPCAGRDVHGDLGELRAARLLDLVMEGLRAGAPGR
ncbi:hypothetical protein ABZT08_00545 [Streptomyces sp. NPDC005526]|uniref:hypothetical protein n=1 Tax=Streptomyces sp. NPDC005526 TaxID=3156885 RepID=UPI0033A0B9F5